MNDPSWTWRRKTCADLLPATSSRASADGRMPDALPDGPMTGLGGPAPAPVSPSASLGTARGRRTSGTSGRSSRASSLPAAPPVVMGEQVAAAVGKDWLDGVFADLEGHGYACRAAVVPACAVDAPHRRDRLWFVADASSGRRSRGQRRGAGDVTYGSDAGRPEGHRHPSGGGEDALRSGNSGQALANPGGEGPSLSERTGWSEPPGPGHNSASFGAAASERGGDRPWAGAGWLRGADGKARRVEPGIRLLAHGVPGRVGQLRALGNAIVPRAAKEIIGAYLDCAP